MFKYFILIWVVVTIAVSGFAQEAKYTAPVKWERFTDTNIGFSIMLPKLPLKREWSDVCNNTDQARYFVYAENAVYSIDVLRKARSKPPWWCRATSIFDSSKLFADAVQKHGLPVDRNVNGFSIIKAVGSDREVWLFHDEGKKRIIELSITHRKGAKPADHSFFTSLLSDNSLSGRLIGEGTEQILGDEVSEPETSSALNQLPVRELPKGSGQGSGYGSGANSSTGSSDNLATPYKIVFQPKATYTDNARQMNVQGSVILRITLLANGTIGTVTVTKKLSEGLTEQAISAARSIVFLPKQVNGINTSVIITREYTFSIY